MADDFKYHIDHHASLLPPAELVETRAAQLRGAVDGAALLAAEETAISQALLAQRRLGLAALSDGEFRRRNHLSVVYDGVAGFADRPLPGGAFADLVGIAHAPEVRGLTDRPVGQGRLAKHEADYLLSGTDRPTLVALPSPGFLAELSGGVAVTGGEAGQGGTSGTAGRVEQVEQVGADLARILGAEIAALAADGIRYVLLTNPAYTFLLTEQGRSQARSRGIDPDSTIERMSQVDAQVLAGLETPAEFRVGLDITTAGAVGGGYDPAAVERFLGGLGFGRLCVEYPAAPAERFPLGQLPAGLVMSLGIVDVDDPELEPVDELVGRIDDAAALIDVDDIAISTNGGFHATAVPLDAAHQRAKLQRVEMVARYFWGNEL
ncbi:methionine synthase [Frankia sp. CcI49]|uniref:methionine synthase n=1 Tax=Frankia sp. CcI49 TaxID=1745382 RepID=UPI000977694E|nr:methionine synthase [Frankia sp. CcI49]ONH61470.1 methionine synthase [Frankia sp. CcI49]